MIGLFPLFGKTDRIDMTVITHRGVMLAHTGKIVTDLTIVQAPFSRATGTHLHTAITDKIGRSVKIETDHTDLKIHLTGTIVTKGSTLNYKITALADIFATTGAKLKLHLILQSHTIITKRTVGTSLKLVIPHRSATTGTTLKGHVTPVIIKSIIVELSVSNVKIIKLVKIITH